MGVPFPEFCQDVLRENEVDSRLEEQVGYWARLEETAELG